MAKKNNGITLVALVITIIVMLILVAVAISMAVNGELFDYAKKATVEINNAINAEQGLGTGSIIEQYIYNISEEVASLPLYSDELLDENTKVLTTNAKYISDNQVAVIPKGFAIVPGLNGSKKISDGLVITDEVDENGKSIGNEFVWVPVTYTEEGDADNNGYDDGFEKVFYRSEWDTDDENGGKRGNNLMNSTEYVEPYTSGYAEEVSEYNDMIRSVQTNKGFYIGRYEAGSTVARTGISNGTTEMVVKIDAYPYNYVGWGKTISDYTSNVVWDSKDQGLGALALSKAMYANKDVGVISTLCYSVMWDTMLDFIKDNNYNVKQSTPWGNYLDNIGDTWKITRTTAKYSTNNGIAWKLIDNEEEDIKIKEIQESILLTTGANDGFAAKNIFDIAGNVLEWTNEIDDSKNRIYRGGSYFGENNFSPASYRGKSSPNKCAVNIGFRPVLYITNRD